MKLGNDQEKAYDLIAKWANTDEQCFVLSGYAGTGKTTLCKKIQDDIGSDRPISFCAYTGKAASVLKSKGLNATTVHDLIYKPLQADPELLRELREIKDKLSVSEDDLLAKRKNEILSKLNSPEFELRYEESDNGFVIVDEYSMLDETIIGDLKKKCKKILFVGDNFQLPPISGINSLKPDFFMEEVHRQALDNDIIRAATEVRNKGVIPNIKSDQFNLCDGDEITPEQLMQADQILVGTNASRMKFNNWYRAKAGFSSKYPMKGDRVICLKNNKNHKLFNGKILNVLEDAVLKEGMTEITPFNEYNCYDLLIEGKEAAITVWSGDVVGKSKEYVHSDFNMRNMNRFDYAYAITVHKSQGSEFDNLIIKNEPIGKLTIDRVKWMYTAITRAKEKCTYIK